MVSWPKPVTSKQLILLLVIILGIAFAVWYFIFRYSFVGGPLDGMKLSDGQIVKLGQTEKSLKSELGSELVYSKDGNYSYTSKKSKLKRSEALILVEKKRVVLIKAGQEPDRQGQDPANRNYVSANRQTQSEAGAGLVINDLKTRVSTLTPFDHILKDGLKAKGYSLINTKVTKSYYFLNPCSAGDKIILVAVAFSKYEDKAIGDGPGCSTHAG